MGPESTPTPPAAAAAAAVGQRPSPTEGPETPLGPGQSHPPSASTAVPTVAVAAAGVGGGGALGGGIIGNGGVGGRRKIERSCNLCHRRKIRCDKKSPCSSCARGGFACFYPQAGQPVRRVRKTTIADVASRISDLEKTLVAGVGQQQQQQQQQQYFRGSPPVQAATTTTTTTPAPTSVYSGSEPGRPPPGTTTVASRPATASPSEPHGGGDEILLRKGSSSQYFDEVLISRVIEQEHDIQSVLTTPSSEPAPVGAASPFNPMGILSSLNLNLDLTELLPPKWGAIELWKNYVENIEICNKTIHRPTAEILIYTAIDDPANAPVEVLALIFSIFFVSTIVLESNSVKNITGEDKITSLHRFKTGLEQSFAKADFLEHPSVRLLEALALYMGALRIHNPGRGLWTLNGLAIRAAQSIGLHRDGTRLGLSPFESEIRRRLWWHLVARDGRAAEDYGLQNPTAFSARVGCAFPSNYDDADLYPEMRELPPPRPGWTQMTLQLINIQTSRAWHRLAQIAATWDESNPPPESVRERVVDELREFGEGFLKHCNPVVPHQRQTLLVARFIISKVDLVTRQQWFALARPEAREEFATEANLEQALGILENGMSLGNDELLRPYRWSMRAYPQYHMLLYVLWHLCVRPEGPLVERAWRSMDDALNYAKHVGTGSGPAAKMTILETLRAKAWAIRQGLAKGDGGAEKEKEKEKESYPTPRATDDKSEPEAAEIPLDQMGPAVDVMDWNTVMQDFPDWSTLMSEFQTDGLAFPNYLD